MIKLNNAMRKSILVAAGLVLLLGACSTPKQISYFQDADSVNGARIAAPKEITIKPKDKISILVNCKSQELTALFNLPEISYRIGQASAANTSNNASGYTVDENGYINFPVLGKIYVAGLTRTQIADKIKGELEVQGQATGAIVTVEYLNLNYQVLGEVNKPGTFAIQKDATTILDAIGNAGDLTIYGKRDNVKLLRNNNGRQETYVIDLTSAQSLISSPAYYLQQNDVIYVEPNDVKARMSTVNGNNVRSTSFWISLASLASSVSLIVMNAISNSK